MNAAEAPAALVLAGGDLVAWPYAGRRWARVICADSGARYAKSLGLRPDLLVGDFDSITPEVKAALRDVPVQQFPADKDQTDAELAVRAALETDAPAIVLAGALGGRFDHSLANAGLLIAIAAAARHGVATDGRQFLFWLAGPGEWALSGEAGDLFSVVPAGQPLLGLDLVGARWELDRAAIPLGASRGVSNEFARPVVIVRLRSGAAWLIATVQETGPNRSIRLQKI